MLREMTWQQFIDWRDYDLIDPFGEERADLRSGTIASVIANVHSGKGGKRFKPADFMPKFSTTGQHAGGKREPLTDPDEWTSVLKMAKVVAMAQGN